MAGKYINMRVYIDEDNLEKLKQIRNYLNQTEDVKSGEITPWTEQDVCVYLLNQSIREFKHLFK